MKLYDLGQKALIYFKGLSLSRYHMSANDNRNIWYGKDLEPILKIKELIGNKTNEIREDKSCGGIQYRLETRELIKAFNGIQYEVIPEYNLCHYLDKKCKLFLGALSVTHDKKIITAAGSASLASLCHVHDVPIYLFVNSLKFSHKPIKEQNIHKKKENKNHDNCEYCLTVHSHDQVDLKLVDKMFTEDGLNKGM